LGLFFDEQVVSLICEFDHLHRHVEGFRAGVGQALDLALCRGPFFLPLGTLAVEDPSLTSAPYLE